jgi:hypothetical protein
LHLLPRLLLGYLPSLAGRVFSGIWKAKKPIAWGGAAALLCAAFFNWRLALGIAASLLGILAIAALLAFAVLLAVHFLFKRLNREEHAAAAAHPASKATSIPAGLQRMEDAEDKKFQNQMTHLTAIRPERALLLKITLTAIHYVGVGFFRPGTLGGISTIHFARWVILKDGTLLFLSNYDGSWESYLGDFVGKASLGLSSVWTHTARYPRCFFNLLGNIIDGGARHEQQFKTWTREYQQETQFWYSAFPSLSVRNVRDSLDCLAMMGKKPFTEKQAEAWLRLF